MSAFDPKRTSNSRAGEVYCGAIDFFRTGPPALVRAMRSIGSGCARPSLDFDRRERAFGQHTRDHGSPLSPGIHRHPLPHGGRCRRSPIDSGQELRRGAAWWHARGRELPRQGRVSGRRPWPPVHLTRRLPVAPSARRQKLGSVSARGVARRPGKEPLRRSGGGREMTPARGHGYRGDRL